MYRKISLLLLLALIFSINLPHLSWAALDSENLSVDEVVAHVIEHNPQYKAQQNKIQAVKQLSFSIGAWDNPMIGVDFDDTPTNQFLTQSKKEIWFIAQEFPFPGKLTLKSIAVEKEALIEEQNLTSLKLDLTKETKKAYYEFFYLVHAIAVNQENQGLLRKFQQIANKKYSLGKASQQDVLKAMVEISRLTNDLIALEQLKQAWVARINTLMNRHPDAPLGTPKTPPREKFHYTLEQLEELALGNKPELKAAHLEIEKQRKEKLLAQFSYAPDLFTRFKMIDNRGEANGWGAEIGITIPFWFWHKQIPEVKEATANFYESQAKLQKTRNETLFEIKDAFVKTSAAARLEDLYRTVVLTQAQQSLKAAEIGYQTDRIDFLNLLESQRMLQSFNLEYYRAMADFRIAFAELEKAVGKSLTPTP